MPADFLAVPCRHCWSPAGIPCRGVPGSHVQRQADALTDAKMTAPAARRPVHAGRASYTPTPLPDLPVIDRTESLDLTWSACVAAAVSALGEVAAHPYAAGFQRGVEASLSYLVCVDLTVTGRKIGGSDG